MKSIQRMILLSSGLLIAAIPAQAQLSSSAPAVSDARNQTLAQHHYVDGEKSLYFFEDTETTFDAGLEGGVLQPRALRLIQELQIPFSIEVKADSEGKLRRILRFQGGSYREGEPLTFSTVAFKSLPDVIPGFPPDFSYDYEADAKAIKTALPQAYGPYLGNRLGQFVYYKALDIHTFQAKIDRLPDTLRPEGLVQTKAMNVDLPDGIFHNAGDMILDERIVMFRGLRCAYFKGVTMGNKYSLKDRRGPKIYTNYQYTFYVPLEGPKAGLLLRGDMQETVTVPPKSVLQRQLSMEMVGE